MSSIGSAAFLLAVFALSAGSPEVPPYCDTELLHESKSPARYQVRGDRCEGIYAQQVASININLRSFVKSFGEFNPQTQSVLELTWKAPDGIVQNARLRAFSLKSNVYFRMDTAQPAPKGSYGWPTEVLSGQRLGHDDLGILAWIEMPGPGDKVRDVYLPLRAGGPQTLDGYQVTLVPSKKLKKLLLTVIQIDGKGNKVRDTGVTNKDLGGEFAYYGSNEPTVFSTGKLGAPGYYRLVLKGTTPSGEAATKDIDFYHSGD